MRLAVFDFDGTLTRRDTLVPFLAGLRGWVPILAGIAAAAPSALLAGREARNVLKGRVLASLLEGLPAERLEAAAVAYARRLVPEALRPHVLERARWHRDRGDGLLVLSASPEPYVVPAAKLLGFDGALGTCLEVDASGRITGRLEGANCRGAEKVVRLRAHLAGSAPEVWAYGDSPADRHVFDFAHVAYRVTRNGFRRVRPDRVSAGAEPA